MKLSQYLHKRLGFFFLSLIFILTSVFTASYCLSLNKYDKNKSGSINLDVQYINGNSNLVVSEYAISNDVGTIYAPENKVKIMNKIESDVSYDIILEPLKSNEIKDLNKIYISVNGGTPFSLESKKNNVILSTILEGHAEDIIDIRIWMSKEYISQKDLGKVIGLKLRVQEK